MKEKTIRVLSLKSKKIVEANNLDKDELRSKGKGFMHTCKRILQIMQDLTSISTITGAGFNVVTGIKMMKVSTAMGTGMISGTIIGFIVGFIINRLFRFLYDTIEFNTIKEDARDCVDELRNMAKKADKKSANKFNAEADRLEEAIKKYSKKNK